jgi:hypothetical protein
MRTGGLEMNSLCIAEKFRYITKLFSLIRELIFTRRKIVILIIVTILISWLTLSGWNYYDVRYFLRWYEEYFKPGRILEIYTSRDPTFKVAYPPLAILIFTVMYHLAITLSRNIVVQIFIAKIFLVIGFYSTYVILVKKYGDTAGYLWIINPLIYVVISTFQFDLIITPLVLLALYYLIEKKNYYLYGVLITLSALVKQIIALLLIVPLILLIRKRNYTILLKYIFIVVLTAIPILFPFFIKDPWGFIEKVILFHMKRPPQQLSIWAIPYYYVAYNLYIVPSIFANIWFPCFAVYLILVIFMSFKEKIFDERSYMLKYTILIASGFFIISKVVNINYYSWFLPIIIILLSKISCGEVIYKSVIRNYIFAFLWISSYGFFATFAPIIAGDPLFIFEDWCWIPSEILYLSIQGSGFFAQSSMSLVLYIRSTPVLKEFFGVLSRTHYYVLIVIVIIHTAFQIYLAKLALKYLNSEKREM